MVRTLLFVFAGLLVFAVAPRAQAADKVETQSVIYNSKRAELSSSALIKLMKDKLDTAYQDLELVVTSCGGGEVASRAGGANGLAGNWSVSTSTDIDHCNTTISGNKKDGGNFNIGGSVFNGWLPAWISKLTADGNKVSNKALFDYATAEKQKILPGSTPQYNSSGNVADNMTLHGGEKSNHAILFQTTGYTKVLNGVVSALQAAGYTNAEINQMPDDQLTWAGFGEALDALRKQIDANPGKEKAFIDIQAHGGKAEKTVAYAPGKFGQAGGGAVVSAANPVLPITVNDPVALAQLGQDLPKPGGGDYYEDPTIARYGPATLFFSTLAESFIGSDDVGVSVDGLFIGDILMGNSGGSDYQIAIPNSILSQILGEIISSGELDVGYQFASAADSFTLATEEDWASPTYQNLDYGIGVAADVDQVTVPEPPSVVLFGAGMIWLLALGTSGRSRQRPVDRTKFCRVWA